MRKLLFFTLGFAAGIFACITVLWDERLLLIAALVFVLSCFAHLLQKRFYFKVFGTLLFGLAAGCICIFFWKQFYWNGLYDLDGQTVSAKIDTVSYSEKSLYGYQAGGYVWLNHRPYKAIVYLNDDPGIAPGDTLTGTFRFRTTIPNGLKDSEYYQSNGIMLLASAKKDVVVRKAEYTPWYCIPQVIAKAVEGMMESVFPEDVQPFAKALMLGDTDDLDYQTDTAFKVSGIRHIVAVSGLHVALLYGIISAVTGKNTLIGFLSCSIVLALFAAVAGFTPSVCRACIVMILMMLADLLQMEYDPGTELAFAALILMAVNPFIVRSVGFQLSVGSVCGILLFSTRMQSWLLDAWKCRKGKSLRNRFLRFVVFSVSVTIGAMVLTVPLSLYYFGTVCILCVLTNLIVLWLIAYIFFGVLFATAAGFVSSGAGTIIAGFVAVPMRFALSVANLISRIPYASLYKQNQWVCIWVILCYAALGYFLLFRRHRRILCSICAASLAVAVILGALPPRIDSVRFSVLNVGQGQSLLLQSKGHTFIVDCGGVNSTTAANETAQTLLSQSIFHVDGLILTHMDSDHSGGVENLLSRIRVDTLYLPELENDYRDDLLAESFLGHVERVASTCKIPVGEAEITVITTPEVKTSNENSLAVLFENADCAILITGDRNRSGEKSLIATGMLKDVDVLVAGHHGSKKATSEELLTAVTPEILMISVGAGNSYRHPAAEVLERANAHNCQILRTDEQGTLVYRR